MPSPIDITGFVFDRLTVLSRVPNRTSYWLCKCICGKQKRVRSSHLKSGHIRSCGCLGAEQASARSHVLHKANTKTGLSHTPTYQSWCNMKQRCENSNSRFFSYYGGRGIKICDRWQTFENFFLDMGVKPEGKTLDRIDTNGHYEPSNCRWATKKEQQNNRRGNRYISINGITMTISEAADKYAISWKLLEGRIEAGWPIEKAILPQKHHDKSGLKLGGKASGAKRKARTHCPYGHPYSGDNLYIDPSTRGRICRKCRTKEGRLNRLRHLNQL